MAITLPNSFVCILTVCVFLSFVVYQATARTGGGLADEHSTKHKQTERKKQMKEVSSHFMVYWHDIASGTKPTVIPIVKPVDNTTFFGAVNMIDDPLTLGPDLSSKLVGRAQGLYGVTSQKDEFSLLMAMNFVFTDSKYNGSTITIMGRNAVLSKVREMPVIGGTGVFRFARGYVQARTHSINMADATVKYDVHVMHYVLT